MWLDALEHDLGFVCVGTRAVERVVDERRAHREDEFRRLKLSNQIENM